MSPVRDDLPGRLIGLLTFMDRAVESAIAGVATDISITREQWLALLLLADGHGHTMRELAERVRIPPATGTRLVDRLVADNLAHRRSDPLDRRRVLVFAAPAGLALVQQVTEKLHGTIADAIAEIEPLDHQQLLTVLDHLATSPIADSALAS